jgi:hypothetical protein
MPNGLFVILYRWAAYCLIVLALIGLLVVLVIGMTTQDDPDAVQRPAYSTQPDRPLKWL